MLGETVGAPHGSPESTMMAMPRLRLRALPLPPWCSPSATPCRTITAKDDVYGFLYGQKGLMAGLGWQGSKITEIEP
jgi:hypothetical protein